ncbi:MAG: ATP-dependent DNA helicase RecQ, partial [Chitinophagia bacterium]|nr:ATP-dependent DNA helicase RecQ [Chitinophagia bacterium]
KNKGLSINEILNEIETIVASGTKLNLDYIIDQEIDENDQDDIYDYFSNFKEDNLDAVFEEFKDSGMSEEHIQLMRIKFLSEYGN